MLTFFFQFDRMNQVLFFNKEEIQVLDNERSRVPIKELLNLLSK